MIQFLLLLLISLPLAGTEPKTSLATLPTDIKDLIALCTVDSIEIDDNCYLANNQTTTDLNRLSLVNKAFNNITRNPQFIGKAINRLCARQDVVPAVAALALCVPFGKWWDHQQDYFKRNIHEQLFLNKYIPRYKKSINGYKHISQLQKPIIIDSQEGDKECMLDVAPVDKKIAVLIVGNQAKPIIRCYSHSDYELKAIPTDLVHIHTIEGQGKKLICYCAHPEYKYTILRLDLKSGNYDTSFAEHPSGIKIDINETLRDMQTLKNGRFQLKFERKIKKSEMPQTTSILGRLFSAIIPIARGTTSTKEVTVTSQETITYDNDGKNIIDRRIQQISS